MTWRYWKALGVLAFLELGMLFVVFLLTVGWWG